MAKKQTKVIDADTLVSKTIHRLPNPNTFTGSLYAVHVPVAPTYSLLPDEPMTFSEFVVVYERHRKLLATCFGGGVPTYIWKIYEIKQINV